MFDFEMFNKFSRINFENRVREKKWYSENIIAEAEVWGRSNDDRCQINICYPGPKSGENTYGGFNYDFQTQLIMSPQSKYSVYNPIIVTTSHLLVDLYWKLLCYKESHGLLQRAIGVIFTERMESAYRGKLYRSDGRKVWDDMDHYLGDDLAPISQSIIQRVQKIHAEYGFDYKNLPIPRLSPMMLMLLFCYQNAYEFDIYKDVRDRHDLTLPFERFFELIWCVQQDIGHSLELILHRSLKEGLQMPLQACYYPLRNGFVRIPTY